MSASQQSYSLCICTYKRAELLTLLLEDIREQSSLPENVLIVDGQLRDSPVSELLREHPLRVRSRIHYVRSNHSNLAYQRFLAWKVARLESAKILLYLDDDLRILDRNAIARLLKPLSDGLESVAGCTGSILYPEDREANAEAVVRDRARYGRSNAPTLVKLLGSSSGMRPGSLSPSGHRCPPEISASGTAEVQWLRGGVMACRLDCLMEDCFSEDLFALSERGYGHGEDTLLSRRLASKGKLIFVSGARFLHPCADTPKAYATRSGKMGYGTAYSRRLLNDNYRWPADPTLADRLALWKSYAGNTMLNAFRTLRSPKAHRVAYAWGYALGALKGIFLPPSHQRLTPQIDWQKDANAALSRRVDLTLKS